MGSKEFIKATTYRLYVMHVFVYLCAVLYTVFTKAAGITKDMTPIVALCVVYSVSLLLDVIIIRREAALKTRWSAAPCKLWAPTCSTSA